MFSCLSVDAVRELVSGALVSGEREGLMVGFLLARQATAETTTGFGSYQEWFHVSGLIMEIG